MELHGAGPTNGKLNQSVPSSTMPRISGKQQDTPVEIVFQSALYNCSLCGQSFTFPKSLFLHRQQNHLQAHDEKRLKPFKCGQCHGTFSDLKDLKRHIFIHSGEKPFHCSFCNINVRRKDSLIRHLRTMHNQTNPEIQSLVSSKTSVGVRSRSVCRSFLPRKKVVNKCSSTKLVSNAEERLNTTTGITITRVSPASATTTGISSQQVQVQTQSNDLQQCSTLTPSVIASSSPKPIRSSVIVGPCSRNNYEKVLTPSDDRSSAASNYLTSTSSTQDPSIDPLHLFICQVCDKRFTQELNLKRHMRCHSVKRKLYGCSQCGKKSVSLQHLREHSLTHSSEKPHTCELCGKAFKTKSSLKKHTLAIHTSPGSRPFSCRFCMKTFGFKSRYETHLTRSHPGETVVNKVTRRFLCSICSLCFNTRADLTRHVAIHSDEKQFKCCFCEAEFRRKDNFSRHLAKVHKLGFEQVKQILSTILS